MNLGLGGGYTKPPDAVHPAPSPDAVGYFDPWKYIASTAIISPVPIEVVNPTGVDVRRGPGTVGPSGTDYTVFTKLKDDQKFVAFAKANGWYRIYLPCKKSSCAGWIASSLGGTTYAVENPSASQLEIKDTEDIIGLNVRSSPAVITKPSSNILGKVWDGQRFVTFGTPTSGQGCPALFQWRQIYLPQNIGAQQGWVCDYWAQPLSGSTPTLLIDPLTLQNESVPAINDGRFMGFGFVQVNNAGDVVFGQSVDTDGDSSPDADGFFKSSQGVKSKIVATGEPTATDIGTLTFGQLWVYGLRPALINDDGDIVFAAGWNSASGGRNGTFLASNGSITKLFQSGEQVVVRRGVGVFSVMDAGPINNQDDIAFTARVLVNGVGYSYIFLAPSGCRQTSCLLNQNARDWYTLVVTVGRGDRPVAPTTGGSNPAEAQTPPLSLCQSSGFRFRSCGEWRSDRRSWSWWNI